MNSAEKTQKNRYEKISSRFNDLGISSDHLTINRAPIIGIKRLDEKVVIGHRTDFTLHYKIDSISKAQNLENAINDAANGKIGIGKVKLKVAGINAAVKRSAIGENHTIKISITTSTEINPVIAKHEDAAISIFIKKITPLIVDFVRDVKPEQEHAFQNLPITLEKDATEAAEIAPEITKSYADSGANIRSKNAAPEPTPPPPTNIVEISVLKDEEAREKAAEKYTTPFTEGHATKHTSPAKKGHLEKQTIAPQLAIRLPKAQHNDGSAYREDVRRNAEKAAAQAQERAK